MLNINSVPARSLQKSYKSIIESVKASRQPMILTSKNKPQAALVSMEDLEKLKELKAKNSGKVLLELVQKVHALLKDEKLPKDLSKNHDKYLYGP